MNKSIIWKRQDQFMGNLGKMGEETGFKLKFGQRLRVGDIVKVTRKDSAFKSEHFAVIVIDTQTNKPCIWGFAGSTNTDQLWKEFKAKYHISKAKSWQYLTGSEQCMIDTNLIIGK